MPKQTTRPARLEVRITREALAVVRRAAEMEGRSVSDFVAAAQEAAQKAVAEMEVIRLSRDAQEKFVELLLNPPPLAPSLKKACSRPGVGVAETFRIVAI